jgi:LysR family transcriptional regulator, regulator of abg operon
LKLNHLRHLIVVAERGSIRSAARHLGSAQPAITRSIHVIERELGTAVFERKAKGMILTPAGEIFLRRAITVQEELRRAREEIDQFAGRIGGLVSIGLSTASHIALLPYALQRFKEKYPGVFLDISEGLLPAMERGLQNGSLDFYVGPLTESPTSKEFTVEKLFDNARLIFGRKDHPLAGARSLRELTGAKWIGTSVTVASDAELGPLFARAGLPPPRIEIQAHFALTMIMAAASSDLLTMLPQQWRHSPLTTALLHTFEIAESLPAAPICIVRRARLPLTPAAEYFCDMMRRAALHHMNQTMRVAANSHRTRANVRSSKGHRRRVG